MEEKIRKILDEFLNGNPHFVNSTWDIAIHKIIKLMEEEQS